MDILRSIVFLLTVSSFSVANKYCQTCDIKWFFNACEMYCCMYEKVCQNSERFTTHILDQCKCSAPKIVHPYCLMAERGNLRLKHSMCKLLKQYPSVECALCTNLPELPVTLAPTAFVYPTLPPGASTKKPVSEYCRFKEYCYFYAACDCRIHEQSEVSSSIPTTPETTAATPETTAATPKTTAATPETTAATPETTAATPETTAATPETTSETPETTSATPETTAATPETTAATPETTAATPETTAATPETTAATPETTAATPETTAATSKTTPTSPKTSTITPQASTTPQTSRTTMPETSASTAG